MKKGEPKAKENTTGTLSLIAKRVEEIAIDLHDMKRDLTFVKFGLDAVEHNTSIMKVDIERIKTEMETTKQDIKGVKRNTDDIIETDA